MPENGRKNHFSWWKLSLIVNPYTSADRYWDYLPGLGIPWQNDLSYRKIPTVCFKRWLSPRKIFKKWSLKKFVLLYNPHRLLSAKIWGKFLWFIHPFLRLYHNVFNQELLYWPSYRSEVCCISPRLKVKGQNSNPWICICPNTNFFWLMTILFINVIDISQVALDKFHL